MMKHYQYYKYHMRNIWQLTNIVGNSFETIKTTLKNTKLLFFSLIEILQLFILKNGYLDEWCNENYTIM